MKRPSSRLLLPVVSALALTAMIAAPAHAVITVSGNDIDSDGADDNITVSCVAGSLSASGVGPGDACAILESIFVDAGAGTDNVNLSAVTAAAFPALDTVFVDVDEDGADEVDQVTGSSLSDQITGGPSDILIGGEGNDLLIGGETVSGGPGDDTVVDFVGSGPVSGGDGDDRFVQFLASGGTDGGLGTDSWEIDFDRGQVSIGQPVTFTFTPSGMQLAAATASASFAFSGIEELYATFLKDSVQTADATTFPGIVVLRGVSGVDNLIGGAFDDRLVGGTGNDTLTGNGGVDQLVAGDGDDVVHARDGVVDRVDCGAGTDTVVADVGDVVSACETVQLPPVVPETGKIKGPDSVTQPDQATYKFKSPTAGATFQCKLDKKSWKACKSPYKVKAKKLNAGKHKLQVRAVLAGVVDATPSKAKFKVKKG